MDWLLAEMAKDSDGEEGGDGDAAARRNRKSLSPAAGSAAGSAAGPRRGAPPSAASPPDVDRFAAAREAWLAEARFARLSPEAQAAQLAEVLVVQLGLSSAQSRGGDLDGDLRGYTPEPPEPPMRRSRPGGASGVITSGASGGRPPHGRSRPRASAGALLEAGHAF